MLQVTESEKKLRECNLQLKRETWENFPIAPIAMFHHWK